MQVLWKKHDLSQSLFRHFYLLVRFYGWLVIVWHAIKWFHLSSQNLNLLEGRVIIFFTRCCPFFICLIPQAFSLMYLPSLIFRRNSSFIAFKVLQSLSFLWSPISDTLQLPMVDQICSLLVHYPAPQEPELNNAPTSLPTASANLFDPLTSMLLDYHILLIFSKPWPHSIFGEQTRFLALWATTKVVCGQLLTRFVLSCDGIPLYICL